MSELYNLPDGWEWKKLKDVCKFENGDRGKNYPSKSAFVDNGIAVISAKDLNGWSIDMEKLNYINEDRYNLLGGGKIKKDDILFCLRGSLGKCGLVNNLEKGIIASSLVIVRANKELLNELLLYYFNSEIVADLINKYNNGSAQPNLSSKNLSLFDFPLPPLSEQQRIVSKLDLLFEKIDKSIALHQKNMDEANAFMGSVLNDVFGELEENNNPMLRFDTYTKLSRGHNPPKKDFIYEEKEGYLRFIQIRDGSSDKNAVYVPITKRLHLVTKEDLLLVAYRQVGKVFREMEGAFNVALCKIENKDYNKLDTNYLYYIIQSKYVKDELLSRSERALIPSMSVDHLKSIEIPTPQLQIQQKVVKYLDGISQKIEKIKQAQKAKMNSLKALKASILDQAFKGEI